MKTTVVLFLMLATAVPLAAQTRQAPSRAAVSSATEPAISLRGFVMGTKQQFAAKTTFDAVFGAPAQPFWGGGVQVVFRGGLFVEVSGSQFKKDGQRAFVSNGETFRLNIPLTATITPVELSAGYRFRLAKNESIIPYVGAGVGWYHYQETSQFSDSGENIDARHNGFLLDGGVEFRVHRLVGLAADAHYTHIPGILGTGGLSKDVNETDLGGIAARFKLIIGR
jgi:opacity protein-like surface antigen